ncbi:MAG: hypothetical protein ACYCW6_21405 [Candidatus Xenobia bacterium]
MPSVRILKSGLTCCSVVFKKGQIVANHPCGRLLELARGELLQGEQVVEMVETPQDAPQPDVPAPAAPPDSAPSLASDQPTENASLDPPVEVRAASDSTATEATSYSAEPAEPVGPEAPESPDNESQEATTIEETTTDGRAI